MICDQITAALAELSGCAVTTEGSCITTQCLYPSFDPVHVYVVGFGEGFRVHDGGGAARSGWDHGKESSAVRRALARQAVFHQIKVVEDALVSEVPTIDWLAPAILSVANASATAAFAVVDRSAPNSDDGLKERVFEILSGAAPVRNVARNFEMTGKSGKRHLFDFGLRLTGDEWLLIDTISPHHVSISSKYVAFADTKNQSDMISRRFAVYDKELETDDATLIQQVADLVPLRGLSGGIKRELVH